MLTVLLLLRGLLCAPFKSFYLQKNPLLFEMLVTRLPVSCHLYHALLDLLFLQIKATKLCRKFPSCLQTISAAKTHTAACSEEGSLLATNLTFAYTLQRFLSCSGRYFLWMSPRTGSTFQQPQNLASIRLHIQHRLATYFIL